VDTELDSGNALEFAEQYRAIRLMLPDLDVVGGCCGTDTLKSKPSALRYRRADTTIGSRLRLGFH